MKFNNIKKQSTRLATIYISMMVVFVLIMACSYKIPNKRINWHVSESIQQLKTEGIYPRPFFNTASSQLDNFTDAWMLNISISADNKHPLKSSLQVPHRVAQKQGEDNIDKIRNLELSLDKKNIKTTSSYSRYWHGYLGILRPLLIFFSYTEIRFMNMCALFMLFIVVNSLIKKKLGTKVMISFFISMMMVMFPIVPMSLQFSSMFYVTFISMIVVLLYHRKIEENKLAICLFFIIGSMTSFLDLLTAPLISLGIPLVTYILLIQNNEIKQNSRIAINNISSKHIADNIIEVIKNSIMWGLGYGMTWASKWVIASIVLKQNVITDALNQMLVRTSDPGGDTAFTVNSVIKATTSVMFTDFTLKIVIALLIIGIIAMILCRKHTNEIITITPILLIALMPFVWYIILKNHSQVHCWFTYRNLSITLYAVFAFISYSIDTKKITSALYLR